MLAERLDPEAADAFEAATAAAEGAGWGDGAVDDVVLLRRLLETADDDLLKVMGPHLRTVLSALAAGGAEAEAGPQGAVRRVPFGEHLLDAALNEAIDLNGSAEVIGSVHLVLALFFFPGCGAAQVMQSCGIDWRPLRSLVRRLTGRSYYDW